jgi:hypothetical protein
MSGFFARMIRATRPEPPAPTVVPVHWWWCAFCEEGIVEHGHAPDCPRAPQRAI